MGWSKRAIFFLQDVLRSRWAGHRLSFYLQSTLMKSVRGVGNVFAKRSFFTEPWYAPFIVIGKDKTCIDVGANVGFYTTRFARMAKLVFAFEPSPSAFEQLKHNTHGFGNVRCYQLAISDKIGRLELLVPNFFLSIREAATTKPEWIDKLPPTQRRSVERMSVQATTLDFLCREGLFDRESVGLVKIDVEGAEYDVLVGSLELLRKYHPRILLEVHGKENLRPCKDLLAEIGYALNTVKEMARMEVYWNVADFTGATPEEPGSPSNASSVGSD
jgi:FkbM family methyltransferase